VFLTTKTKEMGSDLRAGHSDGAINHARSRVGHRRWTREARSSSPRHPVAGTIRMVGPPVRVDTPGAVRSPAP